MSAFRSLGHLARRFLGSLSRRAPQPNDVEWGHSQLLPAEVDLWDRMTVQDRRHSLVVARRFADRLPDATRPEMAAALLHDVGKVESGLGTAARVVATLVGPRGRRFRAYHEHERLGAELLARVGSDPVTVTLVQGNGRPPAVAALASADHV